MAAARHDLLVMSDSDIRVTPGMLQCLAAEFQDGRLGVATCPYRAVPGAASGRAWRLLGMNTEFLSGMLVARMLEGMKFARRSHASPRAGSAAPHRRLRPPQGFLAEDFVMGQLAAENGYGVILSPLRHRAPHRQPGSGIEFVTWLRWDRSTRRSRPWGYVGQVFTNPLPPAALLVALQADWWPLAGSALVLRLLTSWTASVWVLHGPGQTGRC